MTVLYIATLSLKSNAPPRHSIHTGKHNILVQCIHTVWLLVEALCSTCIWKWYIYILVIRGGLHVYNLCRNSAIHPQTERFTWEGHECCIASNVLAHLYYRYPFCLWFCQSDALCIFLNHHFHRDHPTMDCIHIATAIGYTNRDRHCTWIPSRYVPAIGVSSIWQWTADPGHVWYKTQNFALSIYILLRVLG